MLAWYVGALTAVAAEFLLLSASTIEGGSWHTCYALPVSFESAATALTDTGISSQQSASNRQNSSLVKTISKSATFLLQLLSMSDAACNGRDVLFTHNLGKHNREPQPAPASRPYLHGLSGRYAADAEIRRSVARSLGAGGDICRYGGRLGRHFLRSVCRCS